MIEAENYFKLVADGAAHKRQLGTTDGFEVAKINSGGVALHYPNIAGGNNASRLRLRVAGCGTVALTVLRSDSAVLAVCPTLSPATATEDGGGYSDVVCMLRAPVPDAGIVLRFSSSGPATSTSEGGCRLDSFVLTSASSDVDE